MDTLTLIIAIGLGILLGYILCRIARKIIAGLSTGGTVRAIEPNMKELNEGLKGLKLPHEIKQ